MKILKKLVSALTPKQFSPGFTMIELLVVISVIGVLAVAVLSSINPIEQINKGRDTRTRSDMAQLINAADRYFAIQEYYPWNIADSTAAYTPIAARDVVPPTGDPDNYAEEFPFSADTTVTANGNATTAIERDWDWVLNLTETDEVKDGYANRVTNYTDNVALYKGAGTGETLYACFKPTSNAFKREAADNCANGTTPSGTEVGITFCDTTDGSVSDDNFICLP